MSPMASASSRGHDDVPELRIGSWNLDVPEERSCLGGTKKKFQKHLEQALPRILDVHRVSAFVFHEVSDSWARAATYLCGGWRPA